MIDPRRPLFPLLATCLLTFSSARAEPRVAVLPFAPLDGSLPVGSGSRVAQLLARQLNHVGTPAFEAPLEEDRAARESLQKARTLVAEGEQLGAERRLAAAAARYREAVAAYEQAAALLASPLELAEAHTALGIALALRGREADGAVELERAIVLTPDRPLAGEQTSALFRRTVEALRERRRAAPAGSVEFESSPAGAVVELDGRALGRTPLRVAGVPSGRHLWRVLLPTSAPAGGLVAVPGEGLTRVRATLEAETPVGRAVAGLAENRIDAPLLASLEAASAGAQAIVFGALAPEGDGMALHTFLFVPSARQLTRLPRARLDAALLKAGMTLYTLAGEAKARLAGAAAAQPDLQPVTIDPRPAAPRALTEVAYAQPAEPGPPDAPAGPRRPINPYSTVRELRPREGAPAR